MAAMKGVSIVAARVHLAAVDGAPRVRTTS
jgi:hypothetical protein